MSTQSTSPVCVHGSLARQCRVCELEQENEVLTSAAELQKAVMNAAYEDKCRAERERDAAIVARDRNITTRFIVDRLQKQNATLRAALEQVEWHIGERIYGGYYPDYDPSCPWCDSIRGDGHAPNCARQAALGVGTREGE